MPSKVPHGPPPPKPRASSSNEEILAQLDEIQKTLNAINLRLDQHEAKLDHLDSTDTAQSAALSRLEAHDVSILLDTQTLKANDVCQNLFLARMMVLLEHVAEGVDLLVAAAAAAQKLSFISVNLRLAEPGH